MNDKIIKSISEIIKEVCNEIESDIRKYPSDNAGVFRNLMDAYNEYQDSEREGVDYLFSINSEKDAIACLDGGMSVAELSGLYAGSITEHSPFFFFGVNHPKPEPLTTEGAIGQIVGFLDDIVTIAVSNPMLHRSYSWIYLTYVADAMTQAGMV